MKGIIGNVTLDGRVLAQWTHFPLGFEAASQCHPPATTEKGELVTLVAPLADVTDDVTAVKGEPQASYTPSLYQGYVDTPQLADSFLCLRSLPSLLFPFLPSHPHVRVPSQCRGMRPMRAGALQRAGARGRPGWGPSTWVAIGQLSGPSAASTRPPPSSQPAQASRSRSLKRGSRVRGHVRTWVVLVEE